MKETLRKIGLYFRSANAYWQIAPPAPLVVRTEPLGLYPLDFTPRLDSGHYVHFDDGGLPIRPGPQGRGFIYNYTTMSSFALGHWSRYLQTGAAIHLEKLLAVADFMAR